MKYGFDEIGDGRHGKDRYLRSYEMALQLLLSLVAGKMMVLKLIAGVKLQAPVL